MMFGILCLTALLLFAVQRIITVAQERDRLWAETLRLRGETRQHELVAHMAAAALGSLEQRVRALLPRDVAARVLAEEAPPRLRLVPPLAANSREGEEA